MVLSYKSKLTAIERQRLKNPDPRVNSSLNVVFYSLKLPRLYASDWNSIQSKTVFVFDDKWVPNVYVNFIFGAGVYLICEKDMDFEDQQTLIWLDQIYTGTGQVNELNVYLPVLNNKNYLYSSCRPIYVELYEVSTVTAYKAK